MLLLELGVQPLHVVQLAAHGVGEVAIREAAGEPAERQQQRGPPTSKKLEACGVITEHDEGGDAERDRRLPGAVQSAGEQREQAGDRGEQRRLSDPAVHVERGARQDQDRRGGRRVRSV